MPFDRTCNLNEFPSFKLNVALRLTYLACMLEDWLLKLWQLGGREGIAIPSLLHSYMVLVAEWLLLLALKAPSVAKLSEIKI